MMKNLVYLWFIIITVSCKNQESKTVNELEFETEIKNEVEVETQSKSETERIQKFDKNFLLGKFNYKTDSTFVKADLHLSSKTLYLKREAYNAFLKMYAAAKKDGIDLKIISGTRNFNEQKAIWNRKWKRYKNLPAIERIQKIMTYSSMPSTSRHHWGTDLDLNNLNNSYFETGKGKKIYDWLTKNANKYGFYQVYTEKQNGRTGYNLERWHWSYLPLASAYLKAYNLQINYTDISSFEGAEFAKGISAIQNYVNGISEKAMNFQY